MRALLLIDIQNDFLPGGALPVKEGNELIPLVNEIVHYPFNIIVASKDWHPSDHMSFATNHQGKKPGDSIKIGEMDQILWPIHCVQRSWGAEFAPNWDISEIDKIVYKGTNSLIDSYSAFYDNDHRSSTELYGYLKEKEIKEIFIAGLATDYCVKYSVFDALKLGLRTYVLIDVCRGVNLHPKDSENAFFSMQQAGAILLSVKDLKNLLEDENKGRPVL